MSGRGDGAHGGPQTGRSPALGATRPGSLRLEMRRNIGPFGLKDLFTLVNLMGGVVAIVFAIQGSPLAAAPPCWSDTCWATRWTARWRA